MVAVYSSMRQSITYDLVLKTASFLKEDSSNVSIAITSIMSGILYSILLQKEISDVEIRMKKFSENYDNLKKDLDNLLTGGSGENIYYQGTRFLDSLLGDRINTFTSLVSAHSGLSIRATDRLITLITPYTAAYLGNIITDENLSYRQLKDQLGYEKTNILSDIPPALPEMFEIAGSTTTDYTIINDAEGDKRIDADEKNYAWLRFFLFVVVLILVVLSVIIWWESCH